MELSLYQRTLIKEALEYEAKQLERFLKHKNASDEEWQKLDDIYALATTFEFSILQANV